MSILVKHFQILFKIFENIEFGEKCWKISNLVKFVEDLDFGLTCRKFSKLVKIFKNVDFNQNTKKCWFKSTLSKSLELWSKFLKISILVKIYKNLEVGQNCRKKSQIWSNVSKILDFGPNCGKMLIWVKTYQNVNFSHVLQKCWFSLILTKFDILVSFN